MNVWESIFAVLLSWSIGMGMGTYFTAKIFEYVMKDYRDDL